MILLIQNKMQLKKKIARSVLFQKIITSFIYNEVQTFLKWRRLKPLNSNPHGHFYSPLVSKIDLDQFEKQIWDEESQDFIFGIELNVNKQLELLNEFSKYYSDLPFSITKSKKNRYYYDNVSYGYTDSIMLYSFMRHFKPKNIIEIGSGFSSAVMLDTRDLFCNDVDLTFIEPYPKSLLSIFRKTDKINSKVFETKVQNIKVEQFSSLGANDILFIDSSHVSKTGSDVNYELFKILPSLNSGVIIHFHDIFYPFEYPRNWVYEGRNWNENYLLHAFLKYNIQFEILLFSDYIHKHHALAFEKMPLTFNNTGGSLWLRKI